MTTILPSGTNRTTTKAPVDRQALSTRLLGSAARKSYDPVVDVDWSAPVPEDPYGLSPEWSTLYGTPLWDRLDPSERVTLTIHEYCSISGIGIWFEHLLVQLVLRDIYGDDPAQPHVQWALTEIADECRHSVMFARTAQTFGAPSYGPPPALLELGKAYAARADGPAAYAAILVAKGILDIFQRDLMKDDRVQPLHAGDQPDPRRRGGAAHALSARGGRPAHARAVLLAAAQAPDPGGRLRRDRGGDLGAAAGVRLGGPRPPGGARPHAPTSTTTPGSGTPRPGWSRSCAASA